MISKKSLFILNNILYTVVILALVAIVMSGIVRSDVLLIVVYFILALYLFLTVRKNAFYHLLLSTVIAFMWMLIGKSQYGYNREMLSLLGINLFSLFSWAAGLFGIYVVYSYWGSALKKETFLKRLLLFLAFYWPVLIAVETIAYHVFNIHNVSTAMYVGLPLCDCMHAPGWMQISYFSLGPIYFGICELIGLEKPNKKS